MQRQQFMGLLDMLDGGGAGRAGQQFEGGPFSKLLNELEIRPMGYRRRIEEARPQQRPEAFAQMMAPPPPPPMLQPPMPRQPVMGSPITTTTLPPIGQMSNDQLIQMIREAMTRGPSALGYGPR